MKLISLIALAIVCFSSVQANDCIQCADADGIIVADIEVDVAIDLCFDFNASLDKFKNEVTKILATVKNVIAATALTVLIVVVTAVKFIVDVVSAVFVAVKTLLIIAKEVVAILVAVVLALLKCLAVAIDNLLNVIKLAIVGLADDIVTSITTQVEQIKVSCTQTFKKINDCVPKKNNSKRALRHGRKHH